MGTDDSADSMESQVLKGIVVYAVDKATFKHELFYDSRNRSSFFYRDDLKIGHIALSVYAYDEVHFNQCRCSCAVRHGNR